jgi:hypothetical protein
VPGAQFAHPSYGEALVEAGATQFTFSSSGPRLDLAFLRDWVAWRDERDR